MDFRTELLIKHDGNVKSGEHILTIGSCFADSIGRRFKECKFQAAVNPFGTTYHPFSIHKILKYSIKNENPEEHTFLKNNEVHFNFDFHSSLNGNSREELRNKLNKSISEAHSFLENCNVLILTYGTSWIYERIDNNEAVANCHKKPGIQFKKRLATSTEIVESFSLMHKMLTTLNSTIKIILTVSPVRHLKDSIQLNSVSKSILRMACHELSENFRNTDYFPAFEIMTDDLRDYRFYKNDMIHPTEMAEDYIWEKFADQYFSPSTKETINQWNEIRKAINHRPFQPASPSHQQFLKETLIRLESLKSSFDVRDEMEEIISRIV